MRFQCLYHHRILHYSPKKASKIIIVCIILHNICIIRNIANVEGDDDIEVAEAPADEMMSDDDDNSNRILNAGRRVRSQYINNYF